MGPADILNHRLERSNGEGVAKPVIRKDDAPAIRVPIHAMASPCPCQCKIILPQCLDQAAP